MMDLRELHIKLSNMTLVELRAYARENHITLHHTLKADIKREIYDALEKRSRQEGC